MFEDLGLDNETRKELSSIFKRVLEIKREVRKPVLKRPIVPASQWVNDEYYVGKEGEFIYDYWKEQIIDIFETNRGKYNELILSGGLGCLEARTLISTTLGLKPIAEIYKLQGRVVAPGYKVLDAPVYVPTEDGLNLIQLVKDNGVSETVILKMKSGRVLEGTSNHKFRVNGGNEWKELSEFHVGDVIDVFGTKKCFGTSVNLLNKAYDLGKKGVSITPSDILYSSEYVVQQYLSGLLSENSYIDDFGIEILFRSQDCGYKSQCLFDLFGVFSSIEKTDFGAVLKITDKRSCQKVIDIFSLNMSKKLVIKSYVDSLNDNIPVDMVVEVCKGYGHCYDLSVAENHTYGVYGYMSHNTGKTTFANLALVRKLYELSCYENITALFALMPSSIIAFMYFNVSKTQAELTGYGQFKGMIDNIPYFRDNFPRNSKISSVLEFPENLLFLYGSSQSHSIGLNVIGTILDEANFFQKDSQSTTKTQQDYHKISRMYSSIVNRSASRFLRDGENQSLSILVSSNTTTASFTDQRIKEVLLEGKNSRTKIINARVWEVKPKGTYSEEKFYVFKGSTLIDPFVVKDVNDINMYLSSVGAQVVSTDDVKTAIESLPDQYKESFVSIPVDFRRPFEVNIAMALQDIAGISVSPMGRLFSSRPVYRAACVDTIVHPFYKDEITVATGDSISVMSFLKRDYKPKDTDKPRYIHIDQSYANDSTGLASSYVSGWQVTPSGVRLPIVTVDLKLRIRPPKAPRQISLQKVIDFIFFMRDTWGLDIRLLTQDSFASAGALQVYNEAGISAKLQSVDRTDEAYLNYTTMLYEGRIRTYHYKPEEEELFDLLHFRDTRKVDHPNGGCFVGDTLVDTSEGPVKIKDLVGKIGVRLYSYKDGEFFVSSMVKCWETYKCNKLVVVKLSNGESVVCTPNHKFLLSSGEYIPAEVLKYGDKLVGYSSCAKIWVLSVDHIQLDKEVPVYDIEMSEVPNFYLNAGIVVHNSKDVMDGIVGSVFSAVQNASEYDTLSGADRLAILRSDRDFEEEEEFSMDELIGGNYGEHIRVIKNSSKGWQ